MDRWNQYMKQQYYWMQQFNNNQTWVQGFPDYDNDDDYGSWDTNDTYGPYDHYGNNTWKPKRGQGKGQWMGQGGPDGPMDHGKSNINKNNAEQ